jgi:hypothetical protein
VDGLIMAVEIEHYTDSQGRACMRLRKLGDDPPEPSNLARIRPGETLAHVMTPIEAARGTTRSSIVHMPAPSRAPGALTDEDRQVAAMLGVTPEAFAAQRRAEQTGAGGASRWRSGAAGGDE